MNRLAAICVILSSLIPPAFGDTLRKETHMVEMRDGVRLATDVFMPARGGPAYPVIFGRTPYGKQLSSGLSSYNSYEIAVVIQDVRGLGDSGGVPRPFVDDGWGELQDAYDTVLWLQQQDWYNGRIATTGYSAGAVLQVQMAGAIPPGMAGQLIESAPLSNYHAMFYQGGAYRKAMADTWMAVVGFSPQSQNDVRDHAVYDEFWQRQNLGERISEVDWPVWVLGGWFDIFQQGTIDIFTEIRENGGPIARENVHMIVGPWTHAGPGASAGELRFRNPESPSTWPSRESLFRLWLQDRALFREYPSVNYYTMGEVPGIGPPGNEWRTADEWPPPSNPVRFYLTPDGELGRAIPEEGVAEYTYDPSNPVPTLGGPNLVLPAGSFDQQSLETRDDVLVFTSDALEEPLEVTGRLTAVLYVSTSAADTDFTAKFCDVYPDGRSMLFNDGIQNLRLRSSLATPEPVQPGHVYRIEIDLWVSLRMG